MRRINGAVLIVILMAAGCASGPATSQPVDGIRYRATDYVDGNRQDEAHIAVLASGQRRTEGAKIIIIDDLSNGRGLILYPAQKSAQRVVYPASVAPSPDTILIIARELADTTGRTPNLGHQEIDGRNVAGFRVEVEGHPVEAWIDAETGKLIQVALDQPNRPEFEPLGNRRMVIDQIEIGMKLDRALFSTEPPAGYEVSDNPVEVHQMKVEAQPTTQLAANPYAGKPVEELEPLLQEAEATFKEAIPSLYVLIDAEKRNPARDVALPAIRDYQQIAEALPVGHEKRAYADSRKIFLLSMRATFGDEEAMDELRHLAAMPDSAGAQSAIQMVQWCLGDAAAQTVALDAMEKIAITHRADEKVVDVLMTMALGGARTPQLQGRVETMVRRMEGPGAERAHDWLANRDKQRELIDKPLVIEGRSLDGADFSTAQWKGRVVLVDFWATWCGPCLQQLPELKALYARHHADGLEILGISCDNGEEPLEDFLAQNPDMPWPQLFAPAAPGWHALAKVYNINGIPTLFLIDRKGILRSIDPPDLQAEIIKLLGDKN